MNGVGHNLLRAHLNEIGDQLVSQGVMVLHGRQMWDGLEPARDGMHLTWELPTVFKILRTLKTVANFMMLFCQFHGVPARNTYHG